MSDQTMFDVTGEELSPDLCDMTPVRDICWYDGPMIYVCMFDGAEKLAYFVDSTEYNCVVRYLLVPLDAEVERKILANEIDLRDVLLAGGEVLLADVDWRDDSERIRPRRLWRVDMKAIPEECIPEEGVRLRP